MQPYNDTDGKRSDVFEYSRLPENYQGPETPVCVCVLPDAAKKPKHRIRPLRPCAVLLHKSRRSISHRPMCNGWQKKKGVRATALHIFRKKYEVHTVRGGKIWVFRKMCNGVAQAAATVKDMLSPNELNRFTNCLCACLLCALL